MTDETLSTRAGDGNFATDERPAFELWVTQQCDDDPRADVTVDMALERDEPGTGYTHEATDLAWLAWQARAVQPLPEHADHVREIAIRLRRLGRLAGVDQWIPDDDALAVGAIFTVLGTMASAMERELKSALARAEAPVHSDCEPSDKARIAHLEALVADRDKSLRKLRERAACSRCATPADCSVLGCADRAAAPALSAPAAREPLSEIGVSEAVVGVPELATVPWRVTLAISRAVEAAHGIPSPVTGDAA